MMIMEDEAERLLMVAVEKFHARVEEDKKLKEAVEGMNKEIRIQFRDDGSWGLTLSCGRLSPPRRAEDEGDITVITDTETLKGILDEELNPIVAYVRGRIKVRGKVEDLLALKALLK
mgnify:CR=1 FL=1